MVASNFDIFAIVGGATAYDEVTRFSIKDGQMKVNEELSDFDGSLAVQFLKVSHWVITHIHMHSCTHEPWNPQSLGHNTHTHALVHTRTMESTVFVSQHTYTCTRAHTNHGIHSLWVTTHIHMHSCTHEPWNPQSLCPNIVSN